MKRIIILLLKIFNKNINNSDNSKSSLILLPDTPIITKVKRV